MSELVDVVSRHIVVTPGTAGGKPRVAGRRITVQQIAHWHERLGLSPDEIATAYDLTLGDVHAALAYYHDHRAAIEATMQADEALVAELRQRTPSRLKARMGG
jgi:uncharacterized protein (DUF433 family)